MTAPLFRREVLEADRNRLHGEVSLAVPISWQVIGSLIGLSVLAAVVFLFLGRYSRTEIVTGTVVVDRGVAVVRAPRAGTVSQVNVREGQHVKPADELVGVRAEEDISRGGSALQQVEAALRSQDAVLVAQAAASLAGAAAKKREAQDRRAGLEREIASLGQQIQSQQALVRSAQANLERVRPVAARGFISGDQIRSREETVLARQQQLLQLEQSLGQRQSSIAEVRQQLAQIDAQTAIDQATIGASRSQLAQQRATNSGARAYVLRAPFGGTITALTARPGQSLSADQSLLSVVPDGARLRAELHVPSTAIGFVKPGQETRIAIDAFPYDRFGTIAGRIVSVANAPIAQATPSGGSVAVYLVTVELRETAVSAYGGSEPLRPGMTLSASIVTAHENLFQWLFRAVFALNRR